MANSTMDETIGAVFTGVIVTAMLWGAACVQTYNFFFNTRNERFHWKLLVALAFTLETTYIALFITDLKSHVIDHFGDSSYLKTLDRSLPAQIIVQLSAVAIAQSVFAYRIFCLLERSILAAAVLFTLILSQFATGIAYAFKVTTITSYSGFAKLEAIPIIYAVLAIVASVAITSTLITLLFRYRFISHKRLRDPLRPQDRGFAFEIMVLVLSTGFLPSSFSVAFCATFAAFTHGTSTSWIFSFFFAITGCLWLNSMLASFNSQTVVPSDIAAAESPKRDQPNPAVASAASSTEKLGIDTNAYGGDIETGAVPPMTKTQTPRVPGLAARVADAAAATLHPSADAVDQSQAPPTPEKDQPLARLSRALSRTIRKSIGSRDPVTPSRPPMRGRRPSVASPMSPVERREFGPPVVPPPGAPLPLLPLSSSMSAIDLNSMVAQAHADEERIPRAPPPSVLSAGDEPPSGATTQPAVTSSAPKERASNHLLPPVPSSFRANNVDFGASKPLASSAPLKKNALPTPPKTVMSPPLEAAYRVEDEGPAAQDMHAGLPPHLVRLLPTPGLLNLSSGSSPEVRVEAKTKDSRVRALPRVPNV